MDKPLTTTGNEAAFVLEHGQRLSRSKLWRLMQSFFDQRGVSAWSQGTVPHYITSNSFIADAYAKVVFGFFRDCRAVDDARASSGRPAFDLSQPIYIIELGSGSGRFAFYFLKNLLGLRNHPVLKDASFKYVMTDCAERNVEFWDSHPALQSFVEQGVLDFACYDANRDDHIRLRYSGEPLSAETVTNPIVVISNYFFDSIPQDVFAIEDGQLYERLITLSTSQAETSDDDPDLLNRIRVFYEDNPTKAHYYDDPDFDGILQGYQQRLAGATVLFPIAALKCIRHLRLLSNGRLLLLSADKGYIKEESFLRSVEPEMNLHGSFSMMVNYHAIAQYFQNQGGRALQTSHRDANLNICAFLLGNAGGSVETQMAYHEAIEKGGPDDFYTLKRGIEKHYDDLLLEELTALLRLSNWDSKTFLDSFPALLNRVESASESLREELYIAIQIVWENYYHIGEERDIAFCIAMLLYGMNYYLEALMYFDHSLRLYGPDPSTLYNMAMCHYSLGQLEQANECVDLTLELDPAFAAAKTMLIKIQSELAGHNSPDSATIGG